MEHRHAELLRRTYKSFESGDIAALFAVLADDVTWRDSSLGPLAGEYHGPDEVARFFGDMMGVYTGTFRLEVLDVLANDTHGVVLTREYGEVAGEPITWNGTHIWTLRDGCCTEFMAVNDGIYNAFWATRRSASDPTSTPESAKRAG